MDPQMVWDMMDECDAQVETVTTHSPTPERETDISAAKEPAQKSTNVGWMAFPAFGMRR